MHNRVLIAGTNSGCGKTTVTCAVLSALKARGLQVSAFKCGPDYIDPMFHREAIGVSAHNLDPFFCSGDQLCRMLVTHGGDISVIEGVMGYYDGVGPDGAYSAYTVARETASPVVLVVNVAGMFQSAGAVLHGYRTFRPDSGIRGVIFNGASEMLYPRLKEIAQNAGVIPLGYLPREESLSVGSRHLGLITAGEIDDIRERLDRLGELAQRCIDLDGLLALAASAASLIQPPLPLEPASGTPRVRIAMAQDAAFCFLYQENLELLRSLGCDLVPFSPLRDAALPPDVSGLYLCGGYPELHTAELSANHSMLASIRSAVAAGMPTIAECGGFLYLHATLDGVPMANIFPAAAQQTERLQRFGYITMTAQRDTLLCRAGDSIRAHEFHYYDSADAGDAFIAAKPDGRRPYACCHASSSLYAGFPHLYLYANPAFAENFVKRAVAYAAV